MNIALLISLFLHVVAGIVLMLYPRQYPVVTEKSISVEMIKALSEPVRRKPTLKEPLRKIFNPKQNIGRPDPSKLVKASPSKIAEVARLSDRIPIQNVEISQAEMSDITPFVTTSANLNAPDTSVISGPVTLKGQTDGRGIVTGRVRVPGEGKDGLSLLESDGLDEDGLLGGSGDAVPGAANDLGMIDFINEQEGPQRVVYCLDVSSSMGIAGLNKLPLAIRAIRSSLLNLREEDSFGIVTFFSAISRMKGGMMKANMQNIDKAFVYFRTYLNGDISGNLGTDLLGSLQEAFSMDPTVIVLVTDGLPTPGGTNSKVVTDFEQIIQTVMKENKTKAKIYCIGLEMDLRNSPGAVLLRQLAEVTNGRFRNVTRADLLKSRYHTSSLQ